MKHPCLGCHRVEYCEQPCLALRDYEDQNPEPIAEVSVKIWSTKELPPTKGWHFVISNTGELQLAFYRNLAWRITDQRDALIDESVAFWLDFNLPNELKGGTSS